MDTSLVKISAGTPATHEHPRWMTSSEISALADRGTILPFDAEKAAKAFAPERLRALVLAHEAALIPTSADALAARLRTLWNTSVAPAQIKARDWLAETGRLLFDLPLDIVDAAIDQAVLSSERGFTPTVAVIRSFAEPLLAERKRLAGRLRATKAAQDKPASHGTPHLATSDDYRTTAEILARAWPGMDRHEVGEREMRGGLDPDRPCRAPTREDYLRMGVAPEVLDRIAAPPPADEQRDAA